MPLIELTDVCKTYRLGERQVPALRGVTLSVEAGEMVGVCGPSGSGKTTLANVIGMLDTISSGTLLFDGQAPSGLTDRQRSRLRGERIGFIFQSFHLLPVLSALENVMLPLELQGRSGSDVRALARARLDELGLADHLTTRPDQLSGGEQQRVAIARALVTGPAVILADEPTANLDTDTALSIVAMMRSINRAQGTTFILSTHDVRLLDCVDRRVQLQDGRIVDDVATDRRSTAI